MQFISCPWCGDREEVEYHYGGQAHVAYPSDPTALRRPAVGGVPVRPGQHPRHLPRALVPLRRLPALVQRGPRHRDPPVPGRLPPRREGPGDPMTGHRLSPAADASTGPRRLPFTFNGQALPGFRGDTLASALLGAGVRQVATSVKFGRPRGIVAAGTEDPSALVQLETPFPEPMLLATTVELFAGLQARGTARAGPAGHRARPGPLRLGAPPRRRRRGRRRSRRPGRRADRGPRRVAGGPGRRAVRSRRLAAGIGRRHRRRARAGLGRGRRRRAGRLPRRHPPAAHQRLRPLRRRTAAGHGAAHRPPRVRRSGAPLPAAGLAAARRPAGDRHRRPRAHHRLRRQRPARRHAGRRGPGDAAPLRRPGRSADRGVHHERLRSHARRPSWPPPGPRSSRSSTRVRTASAVDGGPRLAGCRRRTPHRRPRAGRRHPAGQRRLEPGGPPLQPGRRPAGLRRRPRRLRPRSARWPRRRSSARPAGRLDLRARARRRAAGWGRGRPAAGRHPGRSGDARTPRRSRPSRPRSWSERTAGRRRPAHPHHPLRRPAARRDGRRHRPGRRCRA